MDQDTRQQIELDTIQRMLESRGYVTDPQITMSVFLAVKLRKPLLIEGPAGVGKTEIAKTMALALDTDLIRLQCYEGLDAYTSLYEWNYQRQLLAIKLMESDSDRSLAEKESTIFSDDFLLRRPLLQAITQDKSPVLLIDELDRADEEFESFLLELLSDWQITIPEIGTIAATHVPFVVMTSNRMRELSEAVRRRSLYLWIGYPSFDKELAIVRQRVPNVDHQLAVEICRFMQAVRERKLDKTPGIAETRDWADALATLHCDHLTADLVNQTMGLIFKDRDDIQRVRESYMSPILEHIEHLRTHACE